MQTNILRGIIYALIACFIWGLIFVVPLFMGAFTPVEIAVGRYVTYGVISSLLLLKIFISKGYRYRLSIWMKAIGYSFACSVGYYIFVILSMRYSTPAICTLILGVCPITIAFYGNWKEKECSYKSLILPSVLILIGLMAINVPYILETPSPSTFFLGLVCALWALIAWTWYVVANSNFLKHNEIDSAEWSTLVGVGTLFWVMLLTATVSLFFEEELDFNKYLTPGPELLNFMIGSAILGVLCSWLGAFLWNKACFYLPVSLAGQLTIFETLFGISFVYIFEQRLPPTLEFLGICFLLTAILYGIRASSQAAEEKELAESANLSV